MEELKISWNWVKNLKTFNNSPNNGVGPWEETCDCLNTCFWGYNLKLLRRICPETPQWWQTWGLTNDLELDKLVMDFIHLSPFLYCGKKKVLDLEAVEEKGLEECKRPRLGPFFKDVGPNPREWVESCYCLSKWSFD